MTDVDFRCEWLSAGNDPPHIRDTVAQFSLRVGDFCLTRNEDTWSKTIRDSVLVSTYPLATWMAASWWRLHYEPLPPHGQIPGTDWRMAHEIGAANHGYVWPRVLFAADGESMQAWAAPSSATTKQSVRYLNGLPAAHPIDFAAFQNAVDAFVGGVINRLQALGLHDTDLAQLWALVRHDRQDPELSRIRRIEARLGYDPEECPGEILAMARALEDQMGIPALAELAPVYGRRGDGAALDDLSRLPAAQGLRGKPELQGYAPPGMSAQDAPWRRGVKAARALREWTGNTSRPVSDDELYGLLGLTSAAVEAWAPAARHHASLAVPGDAGQFKFVSRKRHPVAKRFEYARFLADHVTNPDGARGWLTATDLTTSRQKFQRAFAAEFLCPVDLLAAFLDGDFSEAGIEEAALHFNVSDQTVTSLLANNNLITLPASEGSLPYRATL